MDLPEAFSVLGAERGMDQAAIRRAYLRTLKKHPPERDPTGFARVREAYELAQRGAWGEPDEEAVVVFDADVSLLSAASVSSVSPLAAYLTQLDAAEEPAERVRIARRAAEEEGSAQAYGLWVNTVDEVEGDEAELEAALRGAIARGHTNFVDQLRDRLPERLDETELTAWTEARTEHDDFHCIARQWLVRRKPEAATRVLLEGYAHLARHPFASRPLAFFAPGLLLELVLQGKLSDARRVLASFELAYPSDARGDAVRFALLRELLDVYDALDDLIASDMAIALRDHRPEAAERSLRVLALSSSKLARAQAKLLEKRAPMLAQLYGPVLRERHVRGEAPVGFGVVMVFLFFLRIMASACGDDATRQERGPKIERALEEKAT